MSLAPTLRAPTQRPAVAKKSAPPREAEPATARLASMSGVRIGISGWTYAPWRGTFFPTDLVQREELNYASRQVSSIEINGTFYSLQRPSSYASWAKRTPGKFLFAVKAPRFITHIRRLKDAAIPLANFFASGVLRLGPKLGPILWQLPPSLPYDAARLASFFALLPRDTVAAAALAKRHDGKVRETWFRSGPRRRVRHALEVRHASFQNAEFIALLRKHKVALVVADTAGKWPFLEDVTADLVYLRLHGDAELYVSGYTPRALGEWARKIRVWRRGGNPAGARLIGPAGPARAAGRDVFVYFDNDVKTRAPYDAMTLAHLLGVGPKPPAAPPVEANAKTARPNWPAYPSMRKSATGKSPGARRRSRAVRKTP